VVSGRFLGPGLGTELGLGELPRELAGGLDPTRIPTPTGDRVGDLADRLRPDRVDRDGAPRDNRDGDLVDPDMDPADRGMDRDMDRADRNGDLGDPADRDGDLPL
jgi:hypothetical protein